MKNSKLTRRRVIQGAATVATASVIPGFMRKAEAQSYPPIPPGGTTSTTTIDVTITFSNSGGAITSEFMGISYDKLLMNTGVYTGADTKVHRLLDGYNSVLPNFFKTANITVLRIADGSDTDWANGNGNGGGMQANVIEQGDVTALSDFLTNVGNCSCIYGTNLGGATVAQGSTNPAYTTSDYAGSELAFVKQTFDTAGVTLLGAEIGNEPDIYQYSFYQNYPGGWTETAFEGLWNSFRTQIIKTSGIPITGPAYDSQNATPPNNEVLGNSNYWSPSQFASDEPYELELLTQHYYMGNGKGVYQYAPNWYNFEYAGKWYPGLLTPYPNTQLQSILSNLKSAVGTKSGPAQFRISECNSYYGGGFPTISDRYGSALWAIDFMFTCAAYGAQGVNFHSGGPDYASYNALAFTNSQTQALNLYAAPLYYGMLFFSKVGTGNLISCSYTGNPSNQYVSVFAVEGKNSYSVVVNNKDVHVNYPIQLNLPQQVKNVLMWELTQGDGSTTAQLTATSEIYYQGGSVGSNGLLQNEGTAYPLPGNTSTISFTVPVATALLITFTT